MTRRAFTLVEVLVVIAIVSLLVSILLPGLGAARDRARLVSCLAMQRQMAIAWALYAGDHHDRAMPLAYWEGKDIGSGPHVFWWGTHGTTAMPPDFQRGFISPYMDAGLHERSPFECPAQAWGSYLPQGPAKAPTSTYGYNGYYLSPAKTPGWGATIGFRAWRRLADLAHPTRVLVFADAMLALDSEGKLVKNSALLDPPMLYEGGGWVANPFPTTAFRHARRGGAAGLAASVRGDLSAGVDAAGALAQGWIGSIGGEPGPWYVPDWKEWP